MHSAYSRRWNCSAPTCWRGTITWLPDIHFSFSSITCKEIIFNFKILFTHLFLAKESAREYQRIYSNAFCSLRPWYFRSQRAADEWLLRYVIGYWTQNELKYLCVWACVNCGNQKKGEWVRWDLWIMFVTFKIKDAKCFGGEHLRSSQNPNLKNYEVYYVNLKLYWGL